MHQLKHFNIQHSHYMSKPIKSKVKFTKANCLTASVHFMSSGVRSCLQHSCKASMDGTVKQAVLILPLVVVEKDEDVSVTDVRLGVTLSLSFVWALRCISLRV